MKKLAFHIAKGGTGKTTLAGNCAYLSSKNKRTVLVDTDPQGNSTSWYVTGDYRHELADYLTAPGSISLSEVVLQLGDGFGLLPTRGLAGGLKNYAEVRLFREPLAFENLNEALADLGFDVAIYDLSPGLSQLERSIIMACDEVVIPVLGEFFSIDGIETAALEIQDINRSYKKDVRSSRLVVNSLNRSFRRHRETFERFKQLDFEVFAVAQDAKIAEAQFMHQPLAVYWPTSKAIPELERLTAAITGAE